MLKTEQDIINVIEKDNFMMDILKSAQTLHLDDWWICAGFVRSKIWDVIHGFEDATSLPDIDLIYFDPLDMSETSEKNLEDRLHQTHANIPWSVKNQARMHLVNNVSSYQSSVDAMSKFPETATALGVTLSKNDEVVLSAPCGIEDVLQCVVTPTAYFTADEALMKVFLERVHLKQWSETWRHVKYYKGGASIGNKDSYI